MELGYLANNNSNGNLIRFKGNLIAMGFAWKLDFHFLEDESRTGLPMFWCLGFAWKLEQDLYIGVLA